MPDSSAGIAPMTNLACPIDGIPLQAEEHGLCCATGHTFDRARAGYTNLLVVQHKASRDPGDSKEMVASRRRVLDAGHYTPIADRLADNVLEIALREPAHRALSVVDAGCGEGYYLNAIAAAAAERGGKARLRLAGIDISKWAIQAAVKRRLPCCWAVASNRHLPFVAGSVDLILSMFGFPLWGSFAAIQPSGGRVLLVDPGPDHLLELRSIIYPSVTPKPPPSLDAAAKVGYRLEDEHRLQFQFTLTGAAEIADLLAMTPHDHRATTAGREALARLDKLALTGDVAMRLLRRGDDATSSL
jgi:23S rRNA (guanine745-N1)-methyltransferase